MPKATAKQTQKRLSHEERRALVLTAAREIFMEQGYGGASMRPIAARAGVTEAMLYRISPSKQELFEDAVSGPLEEAVNHAVELSAAIADTNDMAEVRARCHSFGKAMIGLMSDYGPLFMAVLMTDRQTGSRFYQTRFEPALDQLIEIIKRDQSFWEQRTVTPEFVVRSFIGTCWFMAIDARFGSNPGAAADTLADNLIALIFEGVGGTS